MHEQVGLLLRYGGRGFWVVISSPGGGDITDSSESLAARFERELAKYHQVFARHIVQLTLEDACQVVASEIQKSPIYSSGNPDIPPNECPRVLCDQDFWAMFCHGRITPWRHRDYLRAAFLMLLDHDHDGLGLLEVATKFAAKFNDFKQRFSTFQLQPVSRSVRLPLTCVSDLH